MDALELGDQLDETPEKEILRSLIDKRKEQGGTAEERLSLIQAQNEFFIAQIVKTRADCDQALRKVEEESNVRRIKEAKEEGIDLRGDVAALNTAVNDPTQGLLAKQASIETRVGNVERAVKKEKGAKKMASDNLTIIGNMSRVWEKRFIYIMGAVLVGEKIGPHLPKLFTSIFGG